MIYPLLVNMTQSQNHIIGGNEHNKHLKDLISIVNLLKI